MLSKEKKIEITEKVISSETFKNAPTSMAILRYLVQAEIENRPLKESVIDLEFFGGQADTEKSNPRVRVNIYNLRKKLAHYYTSEGAEDEWQIIIDKGQYGIRFAEIGKKPAPKSLPRIKSFLPYILLIFVLIAFGILQRSAPVPKLWKAFFENKQTTHLYIGDAFGYGGKTISGLSGWTRDFSINSLDEYYKLLEQQPELRTLTSPTDYNYATRMAENATHALSRFFTGWDKDFEIKYATRASFSDIKKGNTIYVGRLKDQKDFTYLFNEANKYFKISDNEVLFAGHPQIPDTVFYTNSSNTETDFALVSRIPRPNNTEQFFFFSNHDIGVIATVEYFTNPEDLKEFTRRHLKEGVYFTALFKAKGKERISLSLEKILVVPFD
ncbi:hypothetical protein [uncultured Draconibacterium sp.]|uniref:hypothetical protein n=1 Tax=uncultured Draconibacterium sp. TaxID=1573823 RepID=UPI003260090B